MDHKQRYKRVRLLVGRINRHRKTQAKKIDILCNNIVAVQRDFIEKLAGISFTANFYGSIVGTAELNSLISTAGKLIENEIADANVVFFLRREEGFELHLCESEKPLALARQQLENCFTPELVENICISNKLCTLEDMFAIGLQGNLNAFNKISAVTIPLDRLGSSLGFILIYRSSQNKLTAEELNSISAVTPGLSQAIASCRTLSHADN